MQPAIIKGAEWFSISSVSPIDYCTGELLVCIDEKGNKGNSNKSKETEIAQLLKQQRKRIQKVVTIRGLVTTSDK